MQNRSDTQNMQTSSLSWGAIFGGVASWASLGALLSLLGLGVGLAAFEVDADTISALSISSLAWFVISGILVMFVAGWISGQMANTRCVMKGALHGLITWGITFILGLVFVSAGLGGVVAGAGQLIGKTLEAGAKAAAIALPTAAAAGFSASDMSMDKVLHTITKQADTLLPQTSTSSDEAQNNNQKNSDQAAASSQNQQQSNAASSDNNNAGQASQGQSASQDKANNSQDAIKNVLNPPDETKAQLNEALYNFLTNDDPNAAQNLREKAIIVLTQNTEMTQQQAEQALNKWQHRYEAALEKAQKAANDASNVLSGVALGAFFTMLLGAIASIVGAAWATLVRRKKELLPEV